MYNVNIYLQSIIHRHIYKQNSVVFGDSWLYNCLYMSMRPMVLLAFSIY